MISVGRWTASWRKWRRDCTNMPTLNVSICRFLLGLRFGNCRVGGQLGETIFPGPTVFFVPCLHLTPSPPLVDSVEARDRDRTGDNQLGNLTNQLFKMQHQ